MNGFASQKLPPKGLTPRPETSFVSTTLDPRVIQAAIKAVEIPEAVSLPAVLAWMAACAVVPYLVFADSHRHTITRSSP